VHDEPRQFLAKWPPLAVAAGFFPVHLAAAWLGSHLMIGAHSAAVIWPGAGTYIAALMLFPRRYWPWLFASGLLAEVCAFALVHSVFNPLAGTLVGLVNIGQAVFAAWLIGRHIGPRVDFSRTGPTARLTFILLVATFVGGVIGAAVATAAGTAAYWSNQQTWWFSGYVGAVIIVPLAVSWAESGVRAAPAQPPPRAWYVLLQFTVLALLLWFVFGMEHRFETFALDSPYVVYAALLWISANCGARRITLALFLVALVSATCTLAGRGPFAVTPGEPFGATLNLQAFLALVVVPLLVVQASIAEKRDALQLVRASDERYRAFVSQSSEAIFRLELSQPMPLLLSAKEQRQWLDKYAWIAEANDAYRKAEGTGEVTDRITRHPPWLKHCLATVPDAIIAGGRVENLECVLPGPYGLDRTLLVSLTTEIDHGALRRLWGVARDITHYRAAQRRLEQQQRKLRALATELTLTEERARRKIAADLHDGLAQSLIGLQMHVAAIRATVEQGRPLPDLSALELTISESTAQVRALLSDLMPPGLSDQDIVSGLRWLAEEFAKRQRVQVEFEDDGAQKPLAESTAVLIYQAARQLLQNVARHAQATVVAIRTRVADGQFELGISDSGVGFNVSDLTFLPTEQGGFGLYSIRERLAIIGGTLEIDSSPGRGTRVRITAPLEPDDHDHRVIGRTGMGG